MNDQKKLSLEMFAITVVILGITISSLFLFQELFPEGFGEITGNAVSSVRIIQPPEAHCNMTFVGGWNLVSFFCISTQENKTAFFQNITGESLVFTYDAFDSSDPWKSMNPSLPNWTVQDFPEYLSRANAYWIYISGPENFFYNGSKRIPSYINLATGWNLVGYPTNIERNVSLVFSNLSATFLEIKSYNNTAGIYTNYNGTGGTMNKTLPYRGYWLNVNTSGVWVVDW